MASLKHNDSGFTIVELLIVIVVIGILATLVITTFSGIQQKARDTVRQTDINAIDSQLEAYYVEHHMYPTLAQMNTDSSTTGKPTWVPANLKGLDVNALKDPNATGSTPYQLASAATANQYAYIVTSSSGGTCDDVTTMCSHFQLIATLEQGGTYEKDSLN